MQGDTNVNRRRPAYDVDPALASAAAAAGDAIVTTDSHGYLTSWNRAAERLLGIGAEQAIGQAIGLLIIPEALRVRHGACFRAAMSGGRLAHGGLPARVEAVPPDGEVMPLAITLGLLAGPDGAPAGAVAVLRRADAGLVPFGAPMAE
ncbi:MAG TPA: PAS domain-containing protein [Streptosporangiaceae bacterium]|nr:PAS domain-containing protein [Streptosporangiaceae bacterium]